MLDLVAPISTTGAPGPRQSRKSASATATVTGQGKVGDACLDRERHFVLTCVINSLNVLYQIGNHGNAAIQAREQQGSVIFNFFFFLPWH